jgi:DNA primase
LVHSPFSGDDAQAILKKGPALKIRGLGAVVQAIDSPALLEEGAEILAACQFPDPDVARLRDALLDLANAGKPIDRGTIRAHLGSSGHSRALRLLIDYPPTGPVLADAPEAREWLIALEQYVAAGVSGGESEAFGTDDASRDAAASPSAWRRHHKQVAERRALRTRLKDVSGGGSGER